jgi:hypothetical protein
MVGANGVACGLTNSSSASARRYVTAGRGPVFKTGASPSGHIVACGFKLGPAGSRRAVVRVGEW